MSNRKYVLDIHKIWDNKEMSVQDKGKGIAKELKEIFPKEWFEDPDKNNETIDFELINIVDWFSDMNSYHGHSIISEFDGIMECLYDWADQEVEPLGVWPPNKMCWIKTQS